MGQHEVVKGYHCAYQLHYHIVFPVKYRKPLLSDEVVVAIKEILLVIEEQYEIEMEQIGCDRDHIHVLYSAHHKVCAWATGAGNEEYHSAGGIQEVSEAQERVMGRGVLDRWVLRSNRRGARKLGYCRAIHQETRDKPTNMQLKLSWLFIPCGLATGFLIKR